MRPDLRLKALRPASPSRLAVGFAIALTACGAKNTASSVEGAGTPTSVETRVLEAGAAMLQRKPPIEAINTYLDGFHFYSGHLHSQMEAHHYCTILNEELIQCAIYDGNVKDAKLMGVEYIVSARLFAGLPESEKVFWHSHVHEVKSGQLVAPGIPQAAEHELMTKLVGTYGKTWHTWHTDRHEELPLGAPQLMMGFTADGQIDPSLPAARDQRFGIRSEDKRKDREATAGADAWLSGQAVQLGEPTLHGPETRSAAPAPAARASSAR